MSNTDRKSGQLLRTLLIVVPFGAGVIFQKLTGLSWKTSSGTDISLCYIRICLMMMFYFVVLRIDFRKLMPRKEHFVILALNLAMGIVPFLILNHAGYRQLALAAFFIGITPTANAAPVVMDFLEGKVEFVLTGFVITNIFIGAALSFLLPWAVEKYTFSFIYSVVNSLFTVAVIPFIAASLTRALFALLKKRVFKVNSMFSFLLWSSTLFVISARSTLLLKINPEIRLTELFSVAALSLILCILNFTIGTLAGAGKYRREASQTLGQKNTTLTIFLAASFSTPLAALGPTFYVLWHNLWNAFQIYRHDGRKTKTFER